MPDRVAFSEQHPDVRKLASYYTDVENSLRLYFSPQSNLYGIRFAGYLPSQVIEELNERLAELEMASALTLLSAVEAAFRIDYLQRCYRKQKGPVSREFRTLHKKKGSRASLEDEILEIWKNHAPRTSALIGNLRGALKFRHWLAHGRYWVPKFQKYDFQDTYILAESSLQLLLSERGT